MKRLLMIAAVLVIPASALAQVPPPPAPRPAPVPPVPMTAPVAPAPVIAGVPEGYFGGLLAGVDRANIQDAMERAKWAMEDSRLQMDAMKWDMPTLNNFDFKFDFDHNMQEVYSVTSGSSSAYEAGLSNLSRRDYDKAILRFDQVISQKGTRADAATYHKAYALYRLGRGSDATAALGTLKKEYPKSAYLKDASVLEAAVRQSAGQAPRPGEADEEELKALALNALVHSDPERALPLIEGVLNGPNSISLKTKAIFVLAQSPLPRAREILMHLAKGGGNPDLQRHAIRYIATGGKRGATSAELREIYDSTQDPDIKRAVLQAWGQSGDMVSLLSVAGGADVVDLRRSAVNELGNAGAVNDLWTIYQKEQNRDLKMSILSRLGSLGAADRLTEVIRSEKDPEVRRRAIRSLGSMRADKSAPALTDLYSREDDVDNKKAIISALANQNNGEALVAIARKENNMTMKREIVSRLSNMTKNKAAMDYMLEIIK
ncbi:MAG TPA: HEAT repeat domain-containing protein [Vicinamibacterales bacterium]|nr:HEAT repeat domain-containing protein [Vicinamibacterales bacterium]